MTEQEMQHLKAVAQKALLELMGQKSVSVIEEMMILLPSLDNNELSVLEDASSNLRYKRKRELERRIEKK
jgi:hypothetical protein